MQLRKLLLEKLRSDKLRHLPRSIVLPAHTKSKPWVSHFAIRVEARETDVVERRWGRSDGQ